MWHKCFIAPCALLSLFIPYHNMFAKNHPTELIIQCARKLLRNKYQLIFIFVIVHLNQIWGLDIYYHYTNVTFFFHQNTYFWNLQSNAGHKMTHKVECTHALQTLEQCYIDLLIRVDWKFFEVNAFPLHLAGCPTPWVGY